MSNVKVAILNWYIVLKIINFTVINIIQGLLCHFKYWLTLNLFCVIVTDWLKRVSEQPDAVKAKASEYSDCELAVGKCNMDP